MLSNDAYSSAIMWMMHVMPPEYCSPKMAAHEAKHRGSLGIEAFLITAQLHCTGHVIRMDDDRLMKITIYSELKDGTCSRGGHRKRYKHFLKTNMKHCDLPPNDLAVMAVNRSEWRSCSKNAVQTFEAERGVHALEAK